MHAPNESELHSPGRRGFSLMEVVLSIAVVGVGLLSILGMFLVGLRATRSAMDDTQMASIAQDYIAYYQQLAASSNNYSSLGVLPNADYTSVVTNENLAYNVRVVVTNAACAQMTSFGTNLLSRVTLQVWRRGSDTNTYCAEVARYVTF